MMDLILQGAGGLDLILTAMRVAVGTFFAISGYHKLFNATRRKTFIATMRADGIPMLEFNIWFVPGVELMAGLGVAVGLLTVLSATGLLAICAVAFVVDGIKTIARYEPLDLADWLDDALYLPETLYCLMLAIFIAGGGGFLSIDGLLF